MAEPTQYNIDEERSRLNREIARLRQQADDTARQYQSQLRQLRTEMDNNLRQTNAELVRQHQQQLESIATAYNAQREELNHTIEKQRELINRMIAEQNKQIDQRIDALEDRLEEQLATERSVADDSLAKMHIQWDALRSVDELRPFTDPYEGIIEKADADAKIAYERQQYQAVTAIMVNSGSMILCWEVEAQSQHKEWLALLNLCQDMLGCMKATLNSINQPIECDGVSLQPDLKQYTLERYDPERYTQNEAICQGYSTRLATPKNLTIEDLRSLLHNMEQDRRAVQDTVDALICLHRAHVRRLRCLTAVTTGLKTRSYTELQTAFVDGDFRKGVLARYQHRYHKDQLIISITTPNPEEGHANVSVKLLPSEAIDSGEENALCSEMSEYIASYLRQQAPSKPLYVRPDPVYVDNNGLYCSNVTMQYPV